MFEIIIATKIFWNLNKASSTRNLRRSMHAHKSGGRGSCSADRPTPSGSWQPEQPSRGGPEDETLNGTRMDMDGYTVYPRPAASNNRHVFGAFFFIFIFKKNKISKIYAE